IVEDLLEKGDTMREEMLEEIRKRPAHHHHHHHHRHDHDHEHEHEDEDEHEHHHHHHDDEEDEEDEHEHHHHHHHEHECCCGEEDEECECCHEDDEEECECCHHHHEDDEDEVDEHEHHHHHHHHDEDEEEDADDVFDTYGFETAKTYSLEKISSILDVIMYDEDLFEHVLRAKGIVKSDKGEWIHFDYVPGEPDVHIGPAAYTGKVCIIGTDLDKEKLSGLFEEK
ncbi:MAG: GTP-binding protein, partial [Erysipelotrichales bacterium]|nr:GTP-binding protein [Erysipelotrichales bacterium]